MPPIDPEARPFLDAITPPYLTRRVEVPYPPPPIEIRSTDDGFFVFCAGRVAENLTWDEMVGHVASLTLNPARRGGLFGTRPAVNIARGRGLLERVCSALVHGNVLSEGAAD